MRRVINYKRLADCARDYPPLEVIRGHAYKDGMISLALYQPDIPQNVGAAIRLCACLGMNLHIIEPCGFPYDPRKIKQSAMDYEAILTPVRHKSWEAFCKTLNAQRFILCTTKTEQGFVNFEFQEDDIILMGRESAGVPQVLHETLPHKVTIPMKGAARSLNIINAAALISGEALRQTGGFA